MKNQVEGHENLWKSNDPRNGVIVNRADGERERYRIARKQALMNLDSQTQIKELKSELKETKEDIKEIKDLLKALLTK